MLVHVWRSDSSIIGKSSHAHVVASVIVLASLHCSVDKSATTFSFDAVRITSSSTQVFESSGSTSITIASANFGQAPVFCMKARLGRSSCEVSKWLSESSLACRSASALLSTNLFFAEVSFLKKISAFQTQRFPNAGITSSIHRINSPCTGAVLISVFGAKFGVYSVSSSSFAGCLHLSIVEVYSGQQI